MADVRYTPNSHWSNMVGIWRVETSDPANPNIGDMYFNTANNTLCYWTGNNWLTVTFI